MGRSTALILAFALAALATPASAATEAYLKSTGSGTACTLVAPCALMQTAVGVAGAGSAVICLDKGAYSSNLTFSINQSVTISCGDGLWEAPHGQIDMNPPANSEIVIEGLTMDAETSGCCNLSYTGQGTLRLRRVRAGNMTGPSSHGLKFTPTGPGTLHVSDSYFYFNGGSGIFVQPGATGYANLHISNTKFERNANGLWADGRTSTLGINVNIIDSAASENTGNGFAAVASAGKAPVTISIMSSRISGNLTNGLGAAGEAASGPGSATIMVGSSMITANVNGISTLGAGRILTYGNNQLQVNGTDGVFSGTLGLR
jgi:hypothetical protein